MKSLLPIDIQEEADDEFYTWVLSKQNERISALTQVIHEQTDLAKQASLLNERGIAYFFAGDFENAINDFSYVIDSIQSKLPEKEVNLVGTALWIRMLCYAFAGQADNTYNDSRMLVAFFTECSCEKNEENKEPKEKMKAPFFPTNCNNYEVVPVAKFAYPEEKIEREECHDRVSRITSKAHTIAALIPEFWIEQLVHLAIKEVSEAAHNCCNSHRHWTECVGSIADVWKNLQNGWQDLMDEIKRGMVNWRAFLTKPFNE